MPKTAIWNVSPGLRVARQHDAVGRVEAADAPAAGVAERERQLAVDPDLGVVVDHDLEDDGRAGRVEVADPLGDRDVDPVPVEADAAVGEPQLRLARARALPAESSKSAPRRAGRRRRCGSGPSPGPSGSSGEPTLDEVDLLAPARRRSATAPPTSAAPSSVCRSTIASGRPGSSSGGPGSARRRRRRAAVAAISGLDLDRLARSCCACSTAAAPMLGELVVLVGRRGAAHADRADHLAVVHDRHRRPAAAPRARGAAPRARPPDAWSSKSLLGRR